MTVIAFLRWTFVVQMLAVLCALPISVSAQTRSATQAALAETRGEPQGFLAEPAIIERAVIWADRHFGNGNVNNGWYTDFWNMVPGAGWFSGGPGYRKWYGQDSVFVDASIGISTRNYRTAQARFELPKLLRSRLAVGSQVRWQDYKRVNFYGLGPDASDADETDYRLKSTNVVGYATVRPIEWLGIGTQIGWLKPSVSRDLVFGSTDQPTFLHNELSVTADTRDFPGHPTRGSVLRGAVANYSDRDTGVFSFRRYEAEGAQFIPLAGSRVVVALRGWLATSETSEGRAVPFYLQPTLGGHNTLRGYSDYRFHDRNSLVLNAETRIAMMTHVDAAVFLDAGNVAARIGDLNLDKRSVGAGLRFHSRRQTFARFDVARGNEGWSVLFRLADPLNLSRITRRTANIPFVP